eukprot:CAMPEP_0114586410 /NCGR_PEP_ID=MMETSP0125-20121206/9647_1 /TAXON_ID=485358 ORGANISM="Aristerostoma sp., Strain ATCC 50986" /NCGR_SAMPLE_ID=MMETSP0125 /ASSEMBLY_ACC=CAM_ASM_000245 /LENGTH=45 /DNA_ID= /DNA_START= /DNA_END= /DNA_ORIENTATION=
MSKVILLVVLLDIHERGSFDNFIITKDGIQASDGLINVEVSSLAD